MDGGALAGGGAGGGLAAKIVDEVVEEVVVLGGLEEGEVAAGEAGCGFCAGLAGGSGEVLILRLGEACFEEHGLVVEVIAGKVLEIFGGTLLVEGGEELVAGGVGHSYGGGKGRADGEESDKGEEFVGGFGGRGWLLWGGA